MNNLSVIMIRMAGLESDSVIEIAREKPVLKTLEMQLI